MCAWVYGTIIKECIFPLWHIAISERLHSYGTVRAYRQLKKTGSKTVRNFVVQANHIVNPIIIIQELLPHLIVITITNILELLSRLIIIIITNTVSSSSSIGGPAVIPIRYPLGVTSHTSHGRRAGVWRSMQTERLVPRVPYWCVELLTWLTWECIGLPSASTIRYTE